MKRIELSQTPLEKLRNSQREQFVTLPAQIAKLQDHADSFKRAIAEKQQQRLENPSNARNLQHDAITLLLQSSGGFHRVSAKDATLLDWNRVMKQLASSSSLAINVAAQSLMSGILSSIAGDLEKKAEPARMTELALGDWYQSPVNLKPKSKSVFILKTTLKQTDIPFAVLKTYQYHTFEEKTQLNVLAEQEEKKEPLQRTIANWPFRDPDLLSLETINHAMNYEYFIGFHGTNHLRHFVPNFAYMLNRFHCLAFDEERKQVCPPEGRQGTEKRPVHVAYEYVPGTTMRDALDNGRLSFHQFLSLVTQMLLAIGTAEDILGFRHNDLHIENMMLRETQGTGEEAILYRWEGTNVYVTLPPWTQEDVQQAQKHAETVAATKGAKPLPPQQVPLRPSILTIIDYGLSTMEYDGIRFQYVECQLDMRPFTLSLRQLIKYAATKRTTFWLKQQRDQLLVFGDWIQWTEDFYHKKRQPVSTNLLIREWMQYFFVPTKKESKRILPPEQAKLLSIGQAPANRKILDCQYMKQEPTLYEEWLKQPPHTTEPRFQPDPLDAWSSSSSSSSSSKDIVDQMVDQVKQNAVGQDSWGQALDQMMQQAPAKLIGTVQSLRYPKHVLTDVEQRMYQAVTRFRREQIPGADKDLVFSSSTRKLLESTASGDAERALLFAVEDLLESTYRIRIMDCIEVMKRTSLWLFLLTRCKRLTDLNISSSQDWFGAGQSLRSLAWFRDLQRLSLRGRLDTIIHPLENVLWRYLPRTLTALSIEPLHATLDIKSLELISRRTAKTLQELEAAVELSTPENCQKFSSFFPRLRRLVLSSPKKTQKWTAEHVQQLLNPDQGFMSQLNEWILSKGIRLDDKAWSFLIDRTIPWKVLECREEPSRITEQQVLQLLHKHPQLVSFRIWSDPPLTFSHGMLEELINTSQISVRPLEYFELNREEKHKEEKAGFQTKDVLALVRACPAWKELPKTIQASLSQHANDELLENLSRFHTPLVEFKLNLDKQPSQQQVTQTGILTVLHKFDRLESIHLELGQVVLDDQIWSALAKLPNLQRIHLHIAPDKHRWTSHAIAGLLILRPKLFLHLQTLSRDMLTSVHRLLQQGGFTGSITLQADSGLLRVDGHV